MPASRKILTAVVFVLIVSQAISSTADQTSCSGAYRTLGYGCIISDDCSKVTCKMDFVNKSITFTLKVNKCNEPVTITASMDDLDQNITWSHTFTIRDDIISVPGFTVYGRRIFVQVNPTRNLDNLHLKVNLLFGGKSAYLKKVTVFKGDLPISTDGCSSAWWHDLNLAAKIAVIVGSIVLTCCCCCCYGYYQAESNQDGEPHRVVNFFITVKNRVVQRIYN